MYLHVLGGGGRDVLADVVGFDWKLAMATVDKDDQLNGARSAEVDERVESRANRPSSVKHVVDEQDQLAVNGERNFGLPDDRLRADGHRRVAAEIVAVERDVERAARHVVAGD